MILYPNAKINIGLHVMEKLENGFHSLETVFYPVKTLYDVLEIVESDTLLMERYGLPYDGDPMDNLCIKAYRALSEKVGGLPPVRICLHKCIPVGGGLGGGSSDASSVLRGLDGMFSLGLSEKELMDVAASVGSDCPFFILNRPAYAEGRGDILSPLENIQLDTLEDNYRIEFAYPGISVSTAEAYSGIVTRKNRTDFVPCRLMDVLDNPPCMWKDTVCNDFERHIFLKYPQIKAEKDRMYRNGAVYASMTGSGSVVYGIFEKR